VLLSDVTRLFISLYSTKMRGGYFRFQAQYLRRLHVPHWRDVPEPIRTALARAGKARNFIACNEATAALYRLTSAERQAFITAPRIADAA
jgi:adenosylcobinamide amidohydrolase